MLSYSMKIKTQRLKTLLERACRSLILISVAHNGSGTKKMPRTICCAKKNPKKTKTKTEWIKKRL